MRTVRKGAVSVTDAVDTQGTKAHRRREDTDGHAAVPPPAFDHDPR